MPRDDADEFETGSGQAAPNSVTSASLTFFVSTGGSGVTWAEDVKTRRYPGSLDRNVQENLEELSHLLPEIPNYIGETRNAKNPSDLDLSPQPVKALYWNGSSNEDVYSIDQNIFEISAVVFPADRGVLAIRLGETHELAIDLEEAFVEGSLYSDTAPSRPVGQDPYSAGQDSDATVEDPNGNDINQNTELADRLPVLTDYAASNFPFLSSPSDPVYEDAYVNDIPAYQLAVATMSVVESSDGDKGEMKVVHYKSREDLINQQQNDPYETYNEFDLAGYLDSSNQGIDFFWDTDTTSVSFSNFGFTLEDTSDTSAAPRRRVSGITYYAPSDDYNVSFNADGLYTKTFLEEGVRIGQINPLTSAGAVTLDYTQYSSNGTQPGSTASYDNNSSWSKDYMSQRSPGVRVSDPHGRTAVQTKTENVLWNAHSDFNSVPSGRLQKETFYDESTRYASGLTPGSPGIEMLPNGSTSSWDPAAQLGSTDLQVRGYSSNAGAELEKGGELALPTDDYSSGFFPTTRDGTNTQYDYSTLSTTTNREYIRVFDVGGPELEGIIEVVSSSSDLPGLIDFEQGGNYDEHPNGVSMWVGPANVNQQEWLDLGRGWEDNHGALLDSEQDGQIARFYYRLDNYPVDSSGFYPLAFRIVCHSNGIDYTSIAYETQFFSVEWKPLQ